MDSQKVLEVITTYREYFEKRSIPKIDFPHSLSTVNYGSQARGEVLAHCHGMLDQMEGFVAEGRLEKAFRWLGFIQGVLWATGCYTIEELKSHNRPNTISFREPMRFLRLVWNVLTGRWYFVYASGHGSGFVRDARLRRKEAAIKEARHWESIADTIGGRAYVTNMFTGKDVPHY